MWEGALVVREMSPVEGPEPGVRAVVEAILVVDWVVG